jgi:hypothetical protein
VKAFSCWRATLVTDAASDLAKPGSKIIAGGTNLLDLMKLRVETPSQLVDISRLALCTIDDTPEGGFRIGATGNSRRARRRPIAEAAGRICAASRLDDIRRVARHIRQRQKKRLGASAAVPANARHGLASATVGVLAGLGPTPTSVENVHVLA